MRLESRRVWDNHNMKDELDRDFYCSYKVENCDHFVGCEAINFLCGEYKRKWPTPEQFRKEYGVKYPKYGAVYCYATPVEGKDGWRTFDYNWFKRNKGRYAKDGQKLYVVCACTPWGKPPKGWKPTN